MSDIENNGYGGGTPDELIRWLGDKNLHTRGYPLPIIEAEETVHAALPARATKDSVNYEIFMFSPMTAQQFTNGRGGDALAANARATVRATFAPNNWRVYFMSADAGQILWVAPGPDAEFPAEFCQNQLAKMKSDELSIPGRGSELSLHADSGNTASLTVVVVAENNVGSAEK